jgi:hypothetical protein
MPPVHKRLHIHLDTTSASKPTTTVVLANTNPNSTRTQLKPTHLIPHHPL